MTDVVRKHPQARCEECPLYTEGDFVPTKFGEKNGVVFVGEAPGANEVRKQEPFVGISGKVLDAVLAEHGLARSDATLANAVACRPPGNATPSAAAQRACRPRLWADLRQASPEFVVTLGAVSTSVVLDRKVKITTERVGPPRSLDGEPFRVVPSFHPAACLRNPNSFPSLVSDVAKVTRKGAVAHVKWEPPRYRVYDGYTQAGLVLGQLLSGKYPLLTLDLEVGEDKDESFGHPEVIQAAGFCYKPGHVAVIGENALRSLRVRRALAALVKAKKVVFQNGKYDQGVLHRLGIVSAEAYADTMLQSYALDERKGVHGLGYLGMEKLGTPNWKKEFDKEGGFKKAPRDVLYRYNAIDAAVTYDLYEYQHALMDSDDRRWHDHLVWAANSLMYMEAEGIKLDVKLLNSMAQDMLEELSELLAVLQYEVPDVDSETFIRLTRKKGFNPNSTPQVKEVLNSLLSFPVDSTDADTLQWIIDTAMGPPQLRRFCELMLKWRALSKLYGTYVKGWLNRMDSAHRVRPTYLLHGTETGRTSSRNPNVQNPPRIGFRDAIIADEGNVLLYGDFKNIEGRVVAYLARSESMRQALAAGRDVHDEVAAAFYGPNFTKEQRVLAKTVVHGANYERTPEGIAEGLGVPIAEARKVHNTYHKQYPEIRPWQRSIKRQVLHEDGDLISPWGAKRRFGLITRDNQEDVYKEALAFLPQNIASQICMTAQVRLRDQGIHTRVFIHDGILAECSEADASFVAKLMQETMEEAGREYTTYVPFPAEVKAGLSWGAID